MNFQKVTFKNHAGQTLSARIDFPMDGKPAAYALFAHCFTCSKNLKAVGHISRALTQQRIAVFRFDFTGLGESEGDFADTNFSSNVEDLLAAAEFMAAEFSAPEILVGHSLGGAAVLQAAGRIPTVKAVATIGAPYNPGHVTHLLGSSQAEIGANGKADVNLGGRTFTIKKQFLDDLDETNMKQAIGTLHRALLVLHSPIDNTVGIENAAGIFGDAKHPKSFISLDTADHLLTNEEDSLYAGAMIAAWGRKYVALPETNTDTLKADPGDNRTVVRTGRDHYRTEILANGHGLVADEPKSVGGTDQGPTPYGLLAAALGACTTITLRMYADRKEWPLEEVTVRVLHKKMHAADCEDCATKNGQIDFLEREIELVGPLDTEQRQRLLDIADKCPVHKTLHSEVKINTVLKELA